MRVCVLHNPNAGSAGQLAAAREALATHARVTVADGADLKTAAAKAARGRYDVLAVAGGDGTVHAVVNALAPDFPKAPLAVLPLGTGNDLCRTLGVPLDPVEAAGLVTAGRRRAIDVARVTGGFTGYMANAATGGFSGRVAKDVTSDLKQAWGPLAYLRGAAGPIAARESYKLTVRLDGGPPEEFDALNVVVANARTAAGGVLVAPGADPEDGKLDVVVVRAGDVFDLSVVAARLMAGDYHDDEAVAHRRAAKVEVAADRPVPFSVDGELVEGTGFTFEVLPKALRVLTGPGYRHDPKAEAADGDEPDLVRRGLGHRLFGLVAAFLFLLVRTPRVYAVGLGVAAVAAGGFVAVAGAVTRGGLDGWNEAVIRRVRAAESPGRTSVAVGLTRLADPGVTAVLGGAAVAGLTARRRYLTAATLVAILAGTAVLELTLKPLFALARPDLFDRLTAAGGYSFPSGHALRAVGLFGGGAALLATARPRAGWRVGLAAGLLAVAAGVCWTRVYLGVHYPTDVIAGALAAAGWVSGCLAARHFAQGRVGRPA